MSCFEREKIVKLRPITSLQNLNFVPRLKITVKDIIPLLIATKGKIKGLDLFLFFTRIYVVVQLILYEITMSARHVTCCVCCPSERDIHQSYLTNY